MGEDAVGLVGVDDARIGVGDDQPVTVAVGDGLGDVEAAGAAGELQLAEGIEKDRENAEDRQQRDYERDRPDPERWRQQQEGRHRAAQDDGEGEQQGRAGGALDPVDGGRRIGVHDEPLCPSPARRRSCDPRAAAADRRHAACAGRAGVPPSAGSSGVSRTAPVFMTHMICYERPPRSESHNCAQSDSDIFSSPLATGTNPAKARGRRRLDIACSRLEIGCRPTSEPCRSWWSRGWLSRRR